jgi:rhodanese-related sulfurtransferase
MTAIHPRQALGQPGLVLVDLRPPSERYGGMGFPPGSLHVPGHLDVERWAAAVRQAAGPHTPVLVCLSGTRARTLAEAHGWSYLEGGVLAWGAEGLPLAGRHVTRPSDDPPLPVEAFPRHMAACFVGELAEAALDHPALDPLALLHRCFERAGVSFTEPTLEGLLRALDQAALASLELGTPAERVAENLDHMLSRLPRLPGWSRVA